VGLGHPNPRHHRGSRDSPRTEPGTTGWGGRHGLVPARRSQAEVLGERVGRLPRHPKPHAGPRHPNGRRWPPAEPRRHHLRRQLGQRQVHEQVCPCMCNPCSSVVDVKADHSRCNSCPPHCLGTSQTPRRRIPAEKAHGGRGRLWSARSHAARSSCCSPGGVCGAGVMGTPGMSPTLGIRTTRPRRSRIKPDAPH
jgi:hypothetical protein